MTQSLPSTDLDAAAAVAARLAQVHAALMGGRGPGADAAEIARHSRDRPTMAGRSVTAALAATEQQTALARGELPALVAAIGTSGAELAAAVEVLVENFSPIRVLGRVRRRRQDAATRVVDRAMSELAGSPTTRARSVALLAVGGVLVIAARRRRAGRR